jgi:hypothetical protein
MKEKQSLITVKKTPKIDNQFEMEKVISKNTEIKKESFNKDTINKKYEEQKKMYKTIKTSLKSIIDTDNHIGKINEIVFRMNKIIIHTYNFFKLFILDLYRSNNSFPKIDQYLIVLIIKTIAKADARGRKFSNENDILKNQLQLFYENHYKNLMDDILSYTFLSQLIEYEATSIITSLSNHIQEHFSDAINRIVNIYCKKNEFVEKNKNDKDKLNQFFDELKILKEDILTGENNADLKFNQFKKDFKKNIVKKHTIIKSFQYMIEEEPLDLLIFMIELSIYSEKLGIEQQTEEEKNEGKLIPIINTFPLRSSVIPKYITIDTAIIKDALLKNKGENLKKKISEWRDIWNEYFNLDRKVFNLRGYKFARQISTDGFGCSILFIKEEFYKDNKAMKIKLMKKPRWYKEDIYVDQLTDEQRKEMLTLKLIGADPGKIDLIYATDGNTETIKKENGKTFRRTPYYKYSNKQRIHETKSNLYRDKLLEIKKSDKVEIDGKRLTIEEIESELSKYNASSCNWENFMNYLRVKIKINKIIIEHYEEEVYRKYKWYGFINRQKTDQKMINKFKKKFGKPEEVGILIGDFDEKGKYMKGLPPTKGVGIRRLFKKSGYKIYLVNEYNTSCKLNKTGEDLIKCRETRTPLALEMLTEKTKDSKLKKTAKRSPYKSIEIISRDLNGSLNILIKGRCILENKEIPEYMDIKKRRKRTLVKSNSLTCN